MTDKPISTIDEAKAALDEEIASADMMTRSYERDLSKAKANYERYAGALYTLKALRARMEPQDEPVTLREVA